MYFRVHYKDGSYVNGNVIGEGSTGWRELEDREITSLELIDKDSVVVHINDCEEYNFMVEVMCDMKGFNNITNIFLMGCKQGIVTIYEVSKATKVVSLNATKKGKEYFGTATSGWRKGE